jgi:hypothetical protein
MGIEVMRGDPCKSVPGRRIVIPEHPAQLAAREVDLDRLRRSYLRNALASIPQDTELSEIDLDFLAVETRTTVSYVKKVLNGKIR